ncbi:cysteine-rich secretory protein LCCL domain-containing 1-like [Saccostrea echinata]|uniref:cysteine-rich secretory protein LCCL domain-containing 1-like n=1 Tax=Saccostrea echinata TaxID=191078 RepID=UPI002A7F0362|nr:cysteine-rich secretory protein LCCL domain-containing 1-like [Saccostrea echinata]
MRRLIILFSVVCAVQMVTAMFITRKGAEEKSLDKREKILKLLRLLKKNYPSEDSKTTSEDGISFELAPQEDEKTELNRRGNSASFMDGRAINPADMSPAHVSLEKKALSSEAQAFLNAHNEKRRIVNPTATSMKEMVWSTDLENLARNYAKNCNFAHNQQRSNGMPYYVGENLYVNSGDISPGVAVTSWDNEKNDYSFTNNYCDPNSKYGCGHYTQVVWANSEYLGCAKHYCSYVTNFGPGYLVVCNYGPGGNVNGARPFTSGQTCSNCPAGYTCVNKLCSKSGGSGGTGTNPCSTNPCKNGGTCSSVSGNAVCQCTSGWTGSTCETQASSNCSPNPCKNGGTCSDNGSSFSCKCSSSWSGSTCETLVTQANIDMCGFENSMCLSNYNGNDVDFKRYSSFTMNGVSVQAPEGGAFAAAYAGYISNTQYAYLMSNYLPEKAVKVTFQYRTVGTARMTFVYKQDGKDYTAPFSYYNSNGFWQTYTVSIPAGKNTFFYFKASLSAFSLVGIDDVKIQY